MKGHKGRSIELFLLDFEKAAEDDQSIDQMEMAFAKTNRILERQKPRAA